MISRSFRYEAPLYGSSIAILPFLPELSFLLFLIRHFTLIDFSFIKNKFLIFHVFLLFLLNLHNFLIFFTHVIFYLGVTSKKNYTKENTLKFLPLLTIIAIIVLIINYQFNKAFQWIDFGGSSRIQNANLIRILPNSPINSLAVTNLGILDAGNIKYKLKLRASKNFKLRVTFWLPDVKLEETVFCTLSTLYSHCQISINTTVKTSVNLVLGEANTWVKNDPFIEIDTTELYVNGKKQLFAWSLPLQRWKGFSFNENAFGAFMAVIGILSSAYIKNYLLLFLSTCPSLVGILFSGSRGALAAFTFGLFVLFLARSRAYKLLPWFVAVALITIVVFQAATIRGSVSPIVPSSQTGLRSLNVADQDSARGRLELWRLATKAWLENPRTFLIGTGDLASAMKVKHDARAQSFGLNKADLTHAHNLWIQTAGESGLLGLSAMLWLWCWVIWRAWTARDASALALLAAIFVINSVDYLFYYAPVHLAFWMAAVGLKPSDNHKQLEPHPTTI
jgi:hypothetical protein